MMTTLQLVLAIVGVGMIGAIVIYNLVQERRFRKEADRLFSHKRDDIMLGEAVRSDPSHRPGKTRIQLTGQEAPSVESQQAVEKADAPLWVGRSDVDFSFPESHVTATREVVSVSDLRSMGKEALVPDPLPAESDEEEVGYLPPPAAAFLKPTVAAHAPTPLASSGLDAQTEYVARLKFSTPAFTSYVGVLQNLRRIGKPVRAFGLRAEGDWEVLTANPRNAYSQMELGLQLADRSGALSQTQLDIFCRTLYTFAADAGGAVSCPDKEEALERARDLDLFCMNVDVLMGLNVIASDAHPFSSEAIHTQAGAAGLVLEREGVYHARDAGGHTLFTLTNQEEEPFPPDGRGLTTHGVTLLFDVPRVANGLNVFDRMIEFGFNLAERLSGRLVDDNGRAVSNDSLNRDRTRLQEFYVRMEKRDMPPGGERALRLFA